MFSNSTFAQFLRFAAVGVVGFVVDAVIVEALKQCTGPMVAQLAAFPVASTVTWALNRKFTFGASQLPVVREWLRYVLANLLGWAANNGTYAGVIFQVPVAYQHPVIAVAAGSIAGMFFNFGVSRLLVFRQDRRPAV
jgi:putative flippase GtrA